MDWTDKSLNILCKNSIDLVEYARGLQQKRFYSIARWIVEEQ